MTTPLDILLVSDLHFRNQTRLPTPHPTRRGEWGALFLRKSLHRLNHLGIQPGLIILLGDLLDDGLAAGAEDDLAELARILQSLKIPVLAVPGNHDGDRDRFSRLFNPPGLHEIGGYGFLVFQDDVGAGDVTSRAPEQIAWTRQVAESRPDLPLIALQHNPLHPRIDYPDYPFMMTNTEEILAGYASAHILLSVSGHYHPGQPPATLDELKTYTLPALCEAPFAFAHLRLEGREVTLREHHLKMDTPGLTDVHCHTEYAYCGTGISARQCLDLAGLLGVETVCLTEHSFQLYFEPQTAWSFNWQTDPHLVQEAWTQRSGRMDAYRRFAAGLRAPTIRLGLEVDLCADGRLLLAPEDRSGWDLLVGAIHALPGFVKGQTSPSEAEALFLRDTERLLAGGVDVLAHPFRFFARAGLARPTALYPVIADLLKRYEVAVEINFHINRPDPLFLRACIERGVPIALGSDGHDLIETGEFKPHLLVLEQAGASESDWPRLFFKVGSSRKANRHDKNKL